MRKMNVLQVLALIPASIGLMNCQSVPPGVEVVRNFEVQRYLGVWYEIARLDHRFERGLEQITATYEMTSPTTLSVLNKGLKTKTGEWETASGKARFADRPDIGQLDVSFFGPFYASYNIIALDQENYSYALVCGPNFDYLWILSRTPNLDPGILSGLIQQAKELGFATDQLIFVKHDVDPIPSTGS